jgi:hypothetical protein
MGANIQLNEILNSRIGIKFFIEFLIKEKNKELALIYLKLKNIFEIEEKSNVYYNFINENKFFFNFNSELNEIIEKSINQIFNDNIYIENNLKKIKIYLEYNMADPFYRFLDDYLLIEYKKTNINFKTSIDINNIIKKSKWVYNNFAIELNLINEDPLFISILLIKK